jgi:hypothetical protein
MLEHFDTVMSFAVVMLLLSLLVTTIVQMLLAVLGLRGSVLQWGLEKVLTQVSPDLKTHAGQIAEAVLKHPMVQHLGTRRATSIRREELVRILDDLVIQNPILLGQDARKALSDTLGRTRSTELELATQELKEELGRSFQLEATRIEQVVDGALADTREAVMKIRLWFDAVMDRTTENFLLKTRWITAGVALLLAFTLHVDALQIMRQLASQPELRAKLVQYAESALHKAENNFVLTAGQQAVASAAVADLTNQFADHPALGLITNAPVNLITREAGKAWLNAQLVDASDRETIVAAYEQNFDHRTAVWLADLRLAAADIRTGLNESTLSIIPAHLPSWHDYWKQPSHLLGTLMTVLFLSLGAPFWYNVLRQLSNLRPAVAQKIEPKSVTGR